MKRPDATSHPQPSPDGLSTRETRLPVSQKAAFCAGSAVEYIGVKMTRYTLWIPFFHVGFGIPPAKLGLILMVLCVWDALMHPLMGNITDNARTRWGRRKPFIFAGALLTALVFPLLWALPVLVGDGNGPWTLVCLLGAGMLLGVCMTCWSMPYYGMQLELTPNYHERTRISAGIALTGRLFSLVGGWVLAIISGAWFASEAGGAPDIVRGMRVSSWALAFLILAFGLLPVFFAKERIAPVKQRKATGEPFWEGLRRSARCAPLWRLIGAAAFLQLGSVAVQPLTLYVNMHVISGGSFEDASVIAGWRATAVFVVGLAGIPVWVWLGERFDKKNMAGAMLALAASGHLLNLLFLHPDWPYLQIIPVVLESFAIGALWVYLPSMKADVADYDELHTGMRREGSLNSFNSLFLRLSLTCALGLGGLLIQMAGIDETLAAQPPEVLGRLKYVFIFLPMLFWSVSAYCLFRYPLNRGVMADIRQTLETRRGAV